MDRRTATAMSYTIIANRVAKKHGIPPEDMFAFMAVCAVSAYEQKTSVGVIATSLMKAPPHVVESLKTIMGIVKTYVAQMESDPAFMETVNAKAMELNLD